MDCEFVVFCDAVRYSKWVSSACQRVVDGLFAGPIPRHLACHLL